VLSWHHVVPEPPVPPVVPPLVDDGDGVPVVPPLVVVGADAAAVDPSDEPTPSLVPTGPTGPHASTPAKIQRVRSIPNGRREHRRRHGITPSA
jgi:hypothetical protein